jgi:hypothetical protein
MRHTRLTLLLVAVALATTAAQASAEDDDTRWYPNFQLGVNGMLNLGDMAGLTVTAGGMHVDAELRVSPSILVSVDYEVLAGSASDTDLDMSLGLTQQRYGAKIRHPILGFGSEKLHGDYFVLAGFGRERTSWNEGGVLTRNYVVTGFGTTLTFSRPRDGEDKKWMIGSFGLRAVVSRAPDPGKVPAGCEGPCDSLTKTAPYDTTLMLEIGMRFGL